MTFLNNHLLQTKMVNDRPEDANYKLELKSLKSAFEVGNSGQHYTPTYDSVSIQQNEEK